MRVEVRQLPGEISAAPKSLNAKSIVALPAEAFAHCGESIEAENLHSAPPCWSRPWAR
jgi:hypothetical protein